MTRPQAAIGLVLIVVASVCAGYLLGRPGSSDGPGADDDDDGPDRIVELDGERALRLTAEDQRRSGIELIEPQRALFSAEVHAIGEVLDLQPLLELRTSLAARLAERETARMIEQNAAQTLERARALHAEDGNVSTRQLQAAQVEHEAARQRYRALGIESENLRSRALHEWGPVLVEWALADSSADFDRLLANEDVVLLVTLPGTVSLPDGTDVVTIGRADDPAALEARLISASPRASPQAPGETWFFMAAAGGLRVGTRVHVRVPGGGAQEVGVVLPSRAVVWYAGRSWIYLRKTPELFVRQSVDDARRHGDGLFIADITLEEESIAGTGAQTLLSEEFRAQIPDEDDDP
ncbi:MAG: hypothetical protein H0W33_07265 [Gammaproteobacteria bacterium]|nr:hypothetical protein [Gammaproteobacteria bacterium]